MAKILDFEKGTVRDAQPDDTGDTDDTKRGDES